MRPVADLAKHTCSLHFESLGELSEHTFGGHAGAGARSTQDMLYIVETAFSSSARMPVGVWSSSGPFGRAEETYLAPSKQIGRGRLGVRAPPALAAV